MQAVMRYQGDTIEYTPVGALSGGAVVVIGSVIGCLLADLAAGEKGAVVTEGVFDVVKKDGLNFTAGDAVFWDATGDPLNGTVGTGAAQDTSSGAEGQMGFAVLDAANGDETVRVRLTSAMVNTTTLAGSMTADDITGSDSSLAISGKAGSAGAGGALIVQGGDGNGSNNVGGAVTIRGGNAAGSGADGAVIVGATNTSEIDLGASAIPTVLGGPLTQGVGASTAAAGSTVSDAGALPAATMGVYPTTGADGTKGVKVHANDKVTGRMLFIGNGVSNQILKVYGPSGAVINGAAADAGFSSASGKGVIMVCLSSGGNTWLAW